MFFSVLCSLLSNDKRLGDSPASPSNVHPDRRRKGGLAQNHAQALLSEHFQRGLSVHSIYYTVFTWGSGGFVYGHLGAYVCTISGGTRRFRKPPGGVFFRGTKGNKTGALILGTNHMSAHITLSRVYHLSKSLFWGNPINCYIYPCGNLI